MLGKSKTATPALLCFLLILPALLVASCSRVQPPAPRKPPFPIITADNLFAVDCVDRQHVWAVGFNSVIVCTADGGKTWEFQKSGVENNLCAVSFVSPAIGWISGRAGIMLHTADGGKTWTQAANRRNQPSVSPSRLLMSATAGLPGEFGTIIHTS